MQDAEPRSCRNTQLRRGPEPVQPEDMGYRCRPLPPVNGLALRFQGAVGEDEGVVIAEDVDPAEYDGLKATMEMLCHALNTGMDMDTFLLALGNVCSFVKDKPWPLPGWRPVGMTYANRAIYLYAVDDDTAVVELQPDVGVIVNRKTK